MLGLDVRLDLGRQRVRVGVVHHPDQSGVVDDQRMRLRQQFVLLLGVERGLGLVDQRVHPNAPGTREGQGGSAHHAAAAQREQLRRHVLAVGSELVDHAGGGTALGGLLTKMNASRRVLLVDLDLRQAKLAVALGLNDRGGTIDEYLMGTKTLDQCVRRHEISGVDYICARPDTPNAPEILESHAMKAALATFADRYDLVVLDSPPVMAVSDARIISQLADYTIFIVHWAKTARDVVMTAVGALLNVTDRVGIVINKVNRTDQRAFEVQDEVFDLFSALDANDEQLDFPVVYASGINGWSSHEEGAAGEQWGPDMSALFETILEHVPVHEGDPAAPLQLQISALDYSTFVGRIGVGRINAGTLRAGMDVLVMEGPEGNSFKGRINQVHQFEGLDRVQVETAGPGDIVLVNGIADLGIGVTVTDPLDPKPLPMLKIDEPTLTMNFCVNTSPLAGREGKFVTSRQIWDRLQKELQSNVALRVRETDEDGVFEVSGRGELHLTILLENMRREGYELAVSKPRVVLKEIEGERCEPIELVTCDIEENHQGGVMQALGERKGELVNMEPDGRGRVRLEYRIPARGLIGFSNEFLNLTRGSGLISNIFDRYEAHKGEIGGRKNGVLISMDDGEIFTYALGKLDDRGRMFVKAGDPVYEGMIVGVHNRDNDLVVNATRTKQLTNFRVSGKEDAIKVTPPIDLNLEYGVEFIEDDELVEITPKSIRLRKRHLKEHERKRASRES